MRQLNAQTTISLAKRYRFTGVILIAVLIVSSLLVSWGQKKAETLLQESLLNSARELDIGLGVRNISVKLFRLQPSVRFTGLSVGTSERELALHSTDFLATVAWPSLLSGTVQLGQLVIEKASIGVHIDHEGVSNWDELVFHILSLTSGDSQALPFSKLLVNNVELQYGNDLMRHEGVFLANGELNPGDTQSASTVEINGDLNNYLLQVTLKLGGNDSSVLESNDNDEPVQNELKTIFPKGIPINIEATLAEARLKVNARVKNLATPFGVVGKLHTSGSNVAQLLRELNLLKTNVSEFSGDMEFILSNNQYEVKDIALRLGASDFSGSMRLNAANHPRTLSGQFHSNRLSIDELLGTGAQPINMETAQHSSPPSGSERLFSSSPFKPDVWFSNLQGGVEATFDTITRGAMRIDDFTASGLFEDNTASLEFGSEYFAGGSLALNADFSAAGDDKVGTRSAKLSLKMQQIQLPDMLSLSGVSSSAGRGRLSGEGTFWLEGFSPSSMVTSLDGGLFTIIEDGELDSMLVEMAGADLMESIGLLIKRDLQQTPIRCGFFDVQASSGVIEIKDFIIDTEDSFFLAKGYADFNDETISMKFEPHPRDASLFAAPTALVVSGSLKSPSIKPGKSLYSRIAVAGALAALAGPAAIVLPFIEVGRGGKPSSCTNLFSQQ